MTTTVSTTLPDSSKPSFQLEVKGLSEADAMLIRGIHQAQPNQVREALRAGANVNLRDPNRQEQSPLAQGANALRASPVAAEIHDVLLNAGADVNAQDRWGASLLDHAMLFEQEDLTEKLLDRGATAEPMAVIDARIPAIARALVTHNTHLVRRLLAAGASIPERWGRQPILLSVLEKLDRSPLDEAGVQDLVGLVMGTSPSLTMGELQQALSMTIRGGDFPSVVQRLVDEGAPLSPVAELQTVFLEDAAGEPSVVVAVGWTPLHEAAGYGRARTLALLLNLGMDPYQPANVPNGGSLNVLDVARGTGHLNLVTCMEQHLLRPLMQENGSDGRPRAARSRL